MFKEEQMNYTSLTYLLKEWTILSLREKILHPVRVEYKGGRKIQPRVESNTLAHGDDRPNCHMIVILP